jgi:hypothetical protein
LSTIPERAAEGTVVGGLVLVGRPVAQVADVDLRQLRLQGAPDDALRQETVEHGREKR